LVAAKNIRDIGQDKHRAAPLQRSPVNKEGLFAVLPLFLPFPSLPIEHR
jgi:hypothetical protein